MVKALRVLLVTITIIGLSNESCLLSSETSKMSFLVSIRKRIDPNINKIICIGLIIGMDQILIPTKCLSQKTMSGYYSGTELKALTGDGDNSCVQVRNAKNYQSLNTDDKDGRDLPPSLLRYVAKLEVEPFDIQQGQEPSDDLRKLLPDDEGNLRKFMKNIVDQNVTCQVPIFVKDGGHKNKIIQEQLHPIGRDECEKTLCDDEDPFEQKSCIRTLWSPDTFSCLAFDKRSSPCPEYNIGTPILCTELVCGIVKQCSDEGIVIMQLLTVEHLKALEHLFPSPTQPLINGKYKKFSEADLLRTWGSIIGFITIYCNFLGERT